jgi:hypothetical protein
MLVWVTVFLLWCGFRLKYDVGLAKDSFTWATAAALTYILGPVMSMSFWSFFLIFWTFCVLKRLVSLLEVKRRLDVLSDADAPLDLPMSGAGTLNRHNVTRAAWFHGQMLALLVVGLGARAVHHFEVLGSV